MVTLAINSTFTHLNGNDVRLKEGSISSRERMAIVDITFASNDTYPTNGKTLDFSKIKQFKEVYLCKVLKKSFANECTFVPASGNDSATGKLKVFDFSGVELSNGNTALESQTMQVEIRGI